MILEGVEAGGGLRAERYVDGQWRPLDDVGEWAHGYYQGYADGAGGIDYAFTIRRPAGDLAEPWRLRFLRE
ncbi:MAG: hypothetical protein M5U09_24460 [Gammaproteobacteria bacterium]|nr:hypothetical protein [Gammaproteobacteria bacterium]